MNSAGKAPPPLTVAAAAASDELSRCGADKRARVALWTVVPINGVESLPGFECTESSRVATVKSARRERNAILKRVLRKRDRKVVVRELTFLKDAVTQRSKRM